MTLFHHGPVLILVTLKKIIRGRRRIELYNNTINYIFTIVILGHLIYIALFTFPERKYQIHNILSGCSSFYHHRHAGCILVRIFHSSEWFRNLLVSQIIAHIYKIILITLGYTVICSSTSCVFNKMELILINNILQVYTIDI